MRSAPGSGHLFALRGDLTKLACDAVVVPTSQQLQVTQFWRDLVPLVDPGAGPRGWLAVKTDAPDGWGEQVRAFRIEPNHLGRQVWLARTDAWHRDGAWVADSLVQAVAGAARALPPPSRRASRLIALPLAGTGSGGLAKRRGEVVEALLPALDDVARRTGVDVALVLADEQDHAAVQASRSGSDSSGPGTALLDADEVRCADRLGGFAARGQLALFLGAGVSVAAGLPMWGALLRDLARRAGLEEAGLDELDPQDAAQLVHDVLGGPEFGEYMRARFTLRRHALAHALLAGLQVESVVTTNYDNGFELAASAVMPPDRPLRVLPRERAEAGSPFLLKMHGDVARPESIVLTRQHYLEYGGGRAPLTGLVQALLMTRHMLFVGFSLADDNFARLAFQVRQVLAAAEPHEHRMGTVLALHGEPARQRLWRSELDYVAMQQSGVEDDDTARVAARRLEVFLDRLAWKASTTRAGTEAFLLDLRYDAVPRTQADRALRARLEALAREVSPQERDTAAWRTLRTALARLGARSGWEESVDRHSTTSDDGRRS